MRTDVVKYISCAALSAVMAFSMPSGVMADESHEEARAAALSCLKSAVEENCPPATFETDDPLLSAASYTYENAMAAIALMSEGEYEAACGILDAFTTGMEKDAEFKDRFRNAYMAGNASDLPGYWDEAAEQWVQDAYQAGTNTKSSSAASFALLLGYRETGNEDYLNAAVTGIDWILDHCDDGNPGFTSGYTGWEGSDIYTVLTYKSTVDNLWLGAACEMAAEATGWEKYEEAAAKSREFVTESMYSGRDSRFFQGTQEDGTTPVVNLILSEVQALAMLCIGDDSGIDNMEKCLTDDGGYSYDNSALSGFWLEGTAIAALALKETGDVEGADRAISAMEKYQLSSGAFPQASVPELATGEADHIIYDWPSLGTCAWFILAVNGWNPF